MQKDVLNNVHIAEEQVLITPAQLKQKFPLNEQLEAQVSASRQTIADIIAGRDHRLLVVCGPCSVHDPEAALVYARRLKNLSEQLKDRLYIVMRVYFEKPRTTVGWKGLINDPFMDNSFDVEAGLHIARQLLVNWWKWGCRWRRKRSILTRRSIWAICSAGPPSARVRQSRKPTVKWLPVFQCR